SRDEFRDHFQLVSERGGGSGGGEDAIEIHSGGGRRGQGRSHGALGGAGAGDDAVVFVLVEVGVGEPHDVLEGFQPFPLVVGLVAAVGIQGGVVRVAVVADAVEAGEGNGARGLDDVLGDLAGGAGLEVIDPGE